MFPSRSPYAAPRNVSSQGSKTEAQTEKKRTSPDDAHGGGWGAQRVGLRRNRHRRRGRKANRGKQKSRVGRVKVEKENEK